MNLHLSVPRAWPFDAPELAAARNCLVEELSRRLRKAGVLMGVMSGAFQRPTPASERITFSRDISKSAPWTFHPVGGAERGLLRDEGQHPVGRMSGRERIHFAKRKSGSYFPDHPIGFIKGEIGLLLIPETGAGWGRWFLNRLPPRRELEPYPP